MIEIKELFLMAEAIANEKNISQEKVFTALEEALTLATKKQKGFTVRVEFDKNTGEFSTFRMWQVVADDTTFIDENIEFDKKLHIYHKDANGTKIDDFIEEPIGSMVFDRVAAQMVKQIIIQKVREAERSVIIDKYSTKVGEIVSGIVKKVIKGNIFVDLGGIDGVIARADTISGEIIRRGDRIRFLIKEIKDLGRGAQIILSRTDNKMLMALFAMEVPEISEGSIQIMSCSRDAGIRAKIAVKARDRRIDAIGACIGMRGTRIQAIINELNGEKIDVILWDADPVTFVINAIAPAQVSSIVVNENNNSMDIAFAEDQLAKAIGRAGQNIRLAMNITGWKLNVISIEEAEIKQQNEEQKANTKLAEQLGIEASVANVLIAEGFATIDDIAESEIDDLGKIEGLDETLIANLQERAADAQLVQALNDSDSSEVLKSVTGVNDDIAQALIMANINTVEDLAELTMDELLEIYELDKESGSAIIIAAREQEGWFD